MGTDNRDILFVVLLIAALIFCIFSYLSEEAKTREKRFIEACVSYELTDRQCDRLWLLK